MMSEFGENLKKLREKKNIRVSMLADMTGIARRTIYDWEKGKCIPASFSSRKLLADVFHVSPFYFDGDTALQEDPVIKNILERIEKLENTTKQF